MLTVHPAESPGQIANVQELTREYLSWVFTLGPDADRVPTFQGWEAELATLPGIYAPLKGRLLLATFDDQPAGCVTLKPVNENTGELKRLYVKPEFRGRKIGELVGIRFRQSCIAISGTVLGGI